MGVPLKEITDFVDLREFFFNKEEDIPQDSSGNLHIECPFCGHTNKCTVYIRNVFCHRCRSKWSMYEWLTNIEGMDRETAVLTLQNLAHADRLSPQRNAKISHREISDEEVAQLNDLVAKDSLALTSEGRDWWHSRGVSDYAIHTFKLGEHNQWMTIPLRDDYGTTFGIKKRWSGPLKTSPHKTRYECTKGSRVQYAPLIYRNGENDVAIIVGGEIKGLVLWSFFREHNIPWNVITTACGEGPWLNHWNEYMKFKNIAIWCDRDQVGFNFATSIHRNFRSDLPIIMPEGSETKSVDDFILSDGDPIEEIKNALSSRSV